MNKFIAKFKNFVCARENRKQLILIYIFALVNCCFISLFVSKVPTFDTISFYRAGDMLLSGQGFDDFRTPLYPLFLKLTHFEFVTIWIQYIVYLLSILFVFATLKMITKSSRLVLIGALLYVSYLPFLVYHGVLLSESLTISLSAVFTYFLIRFVLFERGKDIWRVHFLMFCLIFIKPALIYLLVISIGLFAYYLFFRRKKIILRNYLPSMFLVLFLVLGYCSIMKAKYGVFGISKVTDVNIYSMLRHNDLINPSVIDDDIMRQDVESKLLIKNDLASLFVIDNDTMRIDAEIKLLTRLEVEANLLLNALREANKLSNTYGWKGVHEIVQGSLRVNFRSFLLGESITRMRIIQMGAPVGIDFGDRAKPYLKSVFNFSLFHLIGVLFFHILLILHSYAVGRKVSLISLILNVCVWLNLITVLLSAPFNYGRLTVPSVVITLNIIIQCTDWFVHFINKKERGFVLP